MWGTKVLARGCFSSLYGTVRGTMKRYLILCIALLIAPAVSAQESFHAAYAGRQANLFAKITRGLAAESGATVRDLATFRDPGWTVLTLAQISASIADGKTTLDNFHKCPTCFEAGVSRFVVGQRPDAKQYIVAGAIEIGVEAVAAHYMRSHGPIRKWYWRYVWTLPQTFSLYAHTQATFHNRGIHFTCDSSGMNCY